MQVTVDVPQAIQKKVPKVSEFLTHLLTMAVYSLKNDPRSLDQVAHDISENAKKRGLTDEKLEDLLK